MSDEMTRFLFQLLVLLIIFEVIKWFWTEANIQVGRFQWKASVVKTGPDPAIHDMVSWLESFKVKIRPHPSGGKRWDIWVFTPWTSRCHYFSACAKKWKR